MSVIPSNELSNGTSNGPNPGSNNRSGNAASNSSYSSSTIAATNNTDANKADAMKAYSKPLPGAPIPTYDPALPINHGNFDTLIEGLDYAAQSNSGYNFYSLRGDLSHTLSYRDLRDQAHKLAHWYAGQFERGSRIGLIAETTHNFLINFMACQYSGMLPVPMPMPVNLGGKDGYLIQIRQMLNSSKASAVCTHHTLRGFIEEATATLSDVRVVDYEILENLSDEELAKYPSPIAFGPQELCYIQYSSGSTSAPKGVIGTQKSVTNNLRGIVTHGLQLTAHDRAASWLPLYHDMGLIGFILAPLFGQCTVDLIAPSDFVRRPLLWLSLMSRNQTTITYSPSFGYELAAKRARKADNDLKLSQLRIAGIGGDMVRPEALSAFADAFAEVGFSPKAFTASYGMAEATLAISFSDLDRPFEIDHVDMGHYNRSGIAQPVSAITSEDQKRSFVKCGRPLPGHEIIVRNDDGEIAKDRQVGQIHIKGPSLTPGYYSDPEASKAIIDGDWLNTGDMGYMLDGVIVITGRAKDLIIINGRNIWPQDIEWAVERVENVRHGGVAAFSIDHGKGERIVAVAECRGGLDHEDKQELRREIAKVIQTAAGAPSEVILVRPHTMIMTSSGKLSRAKMREKYLSGAFDASRPENQLNTAHNNNADKAKLKSHA